MNFQKMSYILIILFFFSLGSLTAVDPELSYDQASGKLVGFDLSIKDTKTNPNDYNTTGSYWANPYQYIGRLNYSGDPTTLTFSNYGSSAINPLNNWYYFTNITNGIPHPDEWREIFFVAKIRILKHEKGSNDHEDYGNKKNIPITANNTAIEIPGAGSSSDRVDVGQMGYDTNGNMGTRTSSGYGRRFKYTYQYQKVWVDLTFIRTANVKPTPLPTGLYESKLKVQAGNFADPLYLHLVGENTTGPISNFLFTIINVAPPTFSFAELNNKNSAQNSYKVGELKYYSTSKGASIKFSSSATTSTTDFKFNSNTFNFPYKVAFDCTKAKAEDMGLRVIDSPSPIFRSVYSSTPSPLGDYNTEVYAIEGDIRIYLEAPITPMAGIYTSTIYCTLTQNT